MRHVAIVAAALAVSACATTPVAGGGGRCDAKPAQRLLGRAGTSELAAEALKLSRADTLRWLLPDQIVTMEYVAGRLNIEVDSRRVVLAIRCG
ncbi:MAG: I78 family peptidase inhibitor [Sphingomonas fennica]